MCGAFSAACLMACGTHGSMGQAAGLCLLCGKEGHRMPTQAWYHRLWVFPLMGLGVVLLLMGTMLGGMVAYLLIRTLVGVWRTFRVARVVDAVSVGATASQMP